MLTSWLCRCVLRLSVCTRVPSWPLECAAGRRGRARLERVRAARLTGEVVLDEDDVVTRALYNVQQRRHRRDLFPLLLEEPVQELLAHQVALVARDLDEIGDLRRHSL